MTRKIETTIVNKTLYKNYWIKALEFKDMMLNGISEKKWNGASLAAIHATISEAV